MSTLSVPLTPKLEEMVNNLVRDGFASNKAEVMRKALKKTAEEEVVKRILTASKEARAGRLLYGDLDELAKNFEE